MKVFDEVEKSIIKKINHGHGYSRTLINIINSLENLQGTRIQIDKDNRKAKFLFQSQQAEPTPDEIQFGIEKQKQLVELLIKHINLFRYLEKEELAIFFIPAKTTEPIITFGAGACNMPSFRMDIEDQPLVDLLIKYIDKEVMPSPSLKNLENNKFVSTEEIRFRRQHFVTWTAIVVSIILGLYGVYTPYQNNISQEKQYQKSLNTLSEKIDQIEKFKSASKADIEDIHRQLSEIRSKVYPSPRDPKAKKGSKNINHQNNN